MTKEQKRKADILHGYRQAKAREKRLQIDLNELKQRQRSVSYRLDDMPHSHNRHGLEEYAARLDQLEEQLTRASTEALKEMESTVQLIEAIPCDPGTAAADCQTVLTLRFIQGATDEEIMKQLHACRKTVYNWYIKGLDLVEA